MKRSYLKSIACFAIATPLIIALIIITIINKTKASSLANFEQEKVLYSSDLATKQTLESIKAENSKKQKLFKHWSTLIDGDSYSKFNANLHAAKEANSKLKTLQIVEQGRTTRPKLGVASNLSACNLTMQGSFTEIQKTLTQLECSTPQLMVTSMSLSPREKSQLLTIKLTYTLWEK